MAGISTPGVDVDFSWPLVAGLAVVAGLLIYAINKVFNSGVNTVTTTAANLASAPANAVTSAINALAGTPGTPGNPSNGDLLYSWAANLLPGSD